MQQLQLDYYIQPLSQPKMLTPTNHTLPAKFSRSSTPINRPSSISPTLTRFPFRIVKPTTNNLHKPSEYSLPNSEIKDMTMRAFSALSRPNKSRDIKKVKKEGEVKVMSSIKGKLYCKKLGEINGNIHGFGDIFEEYYTKIYSDRVTQMLRRPIVSKTVKGKKGEENKEGKLIMKARKKVRGVNMNITERLKTESGYTQKISSIIDECTDCLKPHKTISH